MTRKSLFVISAVTAFLSVAQISLSQEIRHARKDLKNGQNRRNLQKSAERMLDDIRSSPPR